MRLLQKNHLQSVASIVVSLKAALSFEPLLWVDPVDKDKGTWLEINGNLIRCKLCHDNSEAGFKIRENACASNLLRHAVGVKHKRNSNNINGLAAPSIEDFLTLIASRGKGLGPSY